MWFVLGVIATIVIELAFILWMVLRRWEVSGEHNEEMDRYREGN